MRDSGQHRYSFLFCSAPFGGIVTYVQNLKEAIEPRTDTEATWLFMERNPTEFLSHIPPFSVNWTLKGGMVTRSRIHVLEKGGRTFDAAFFNHIVPTSFLREFSKRVPTILSIDTTPKLLDRYSTWYHTTVGSKVNPIEALKHTHVKHVYQRASYILPWSEWVRNSLIEDYGIEDTKIKVVPPAINLRKWTGRPESKEHSESTSHIVRILFVGGEFQRKGGDLLVNISQRREFHNCEFHFVTKSFLGPRADNIFVHDELEPNTQGLVSLYRDADIFALPTRADVFSMAGLEAMAMGLPVIITNVGGTGEIVRDKETGYIVPVDDESILADRLSRLAKDPNLRRQFGEKGRKRVEESFDMAQTAELVVELMKEASHAKGVRK